MARDSADGIYYDTIALYNRNVLFQPTTIPFFTNVFPPVPPVSAKQGDQN